MNSSEAVVALVPTGVVTVTSASPRDPAGELTVIWVAELTVKLAAVTEPKLTTLAALKPVP